MGGPGAYVIGSRYALVRQLGAGGMASVWLALDRRLNDKPVAVKRLHGFRPDGPDAQGVERARREAYAASRISHPNLVAVTDFIADGGEPFIVMEYVDGVTLDDVIARGPMPYEEAARLLGQVASALAEAHEAGIVHRDIKPANIIVTPRGDAKLADFGIARSADDPPASPAPASFTGTIALPRPGDPRRAAPRPPRADMWALGATLFEAVEGRPAFEAPSNVALMAAIAVAPLPVVTRAPAVAPVIARLLDRTPARRPSAAQVASELRALSAPTRDRGAVLTPPPFFAGDAPSGQVGLERGHPQRRASAGAAAAARCASEEAHARLDGHRRPRCRRDRRGHRRRHRERARQLAAGVGWAPDDQRPGQGGQPSTSPTTAAESPPSPPPTQTGSAPRRRSTSAVSGC